MSVICVVVYAYWATGLRPFTLWSYAAVAVPVAVIGCTLAIAGGRRVGGPRRLGADAVRLRWVLPWLLVALAAAGLECLGLALGGRSKTVPTLSTVIDQVLAWHVLRLILFCAWLLIGSMPVIRIARGKGWVR